MMPSPQLIVAEYAVGPALVFGSAIVATVPPTAAPAGPENERPPVGTVSLITVVHEKLCDSPAARPGTDHSIPVALSALAPQPVHPFGNDVLRSPQTVVGVDKTQLSPEVMAENRSSGWLFVAVEVRLQATPTCS